MSEQTPLINILKEVIKKYEHSIEEVTTLNNSSLTINKELIDKLKKDFSAITNIAIKDLEAILVEAETSASEKEEILSYLDTISCLLKLNSEKQTTFQISDNQKEYINLFLEKVSFLEKRHQEIRKKNNTNLDELNKMRSKYKALLSRLEDKNDNSYITNIELLKLLFEECEVNEPTKRNIMLNLMKYNQNIYLHENT